MSQSLTRVHCLHTDWGVTADCEAKPIASSRDRNLKRDTRVTLLNRKAPTVCDQRASLTPATCCFQKHRHTAFPETVAEPKGTAMRNAVTL